MVEVVMGATAVVAAVDGVTLAVAVLVKVERNYSMTYFSEFGSASSLEAGVKVCFVDRLLGFF